MNFQRGQRTGVEKTRRRYSKEIETSATGGTGGREGSGNMVKENPCQQSKKPTAPEKPLVDLYDFTVTAGARLS